MNNNKIGLRNKPLVSVIVVTCNSVETVCETLDSIWDQTYDNLELIVSDDCSWDGTSSVVSVWLEGKGGWENRFSRFELIENKKNLGVVDNCNNAIHRAYGQYVQEIAGDDILLPDAVESKVEYAIDNDCQVVYSKIEVFGDNISQDRIESMNHRIERAYNAEKLDHFEQLTEMLKDTFVCGPMGGFYSKSYFINEMGGYDERFPMIEDYPFHLKYLECHPFVILDKVCVKYRLSPDSLCQSGDVRFLNSIIDFFEMVRQPYMQKLELDDVLDNEVDKFNNLKSIIGSMERKWNLYYKLMLTWMNYKQEGKKINDVFMRYNLHNIAIYGMGDLAELLLNEVRYSTVNIKYGIENSFRGRRFGIDILNIEDDLTAVDAIIITPIFYINEIKEKLSEVVSIPLIGFDEIINRMRFV